MAGQPDISGVVEVIGIRHFISLVEYFFQRVPALGRSPRNNLMPTASITETMPCCSVVVFDLLHDYSRRLEWDTLLREARFTGGHTTAKTGATTLCVGKPLFGIIRIETTYLTFTRGVLAAVNMINHSPFFDSFSASIRHQDLSRGSSVTYKLTFRARPRYLRWILEPIMMMVLRHETKQRLKALSDYLTSEHPQSTTLVEQPSNGESGRGDGIAPVTPPTPPDMRVRIRRFLSDHGDGP